MVNVTKTTNEFLFLPKGKIVPELSWGTIRIKLNISTIWKDTIKLCKSYNLAKKEKARIFHINNLTRATPQMSISIIKDLKHYCHQNSKIIDEIIDVFQLKQIERPKTIPKRPTIVKRARRQLVAIGTVIVGVVTSLISIFTTRELISMTSNENDLTENNNNIISAIQNHETRIQRQNLRTKELQDHVKSLEQILTNSKQSTDLFINLFNMKSYATQINRHLINIQDGLYELFKNRLSPRLVDITTIQRAMKNLEQIAYKRKYHITITKPIEVYQLLSSFVAMENGSIYILIHVPIYRTSTLLQLYEYKPTPIELNNTSKQILIDPEQRYFSINTEETLFSTYSTHEIEHSCKSINDIYHCKQHNILTKYNTRNCLVSLYNKNKGQIKESCNMKITPKRETVFQINSTSFFIYTPKRTQLHISCENEGQQTKHEIHQYNIIELDQGCRASTKDHLLSTGISLREEVTMKRISIDLNLTDLISFERGEEKEFIKLLTQQPETTDKEVPLTDVLKKFHLKILSHHQLKSNIIGSTSTLAIIMVIGTICACWGSHKYKQLKNMDDNTTKSGRSIKADKEMEMMAYKRWSQPEEIEMPVIEPAPAVPISLRT